MKVPEVNPTPFDPDMTMALEEMGQRGFSLEPKEGFQVRRTSVAAHNWLRTQKLGRDWATRDSILWNVLILMACKAKGRTINLEEVKGLYLQRSAALDKQKVEHDEMVQRRPDPDAGDGEVTCTVTDRKFVPMVWNRTVDGKVLLHENGPRQGEPKLGGNFLPSKDGEPKPISREGLNQINDELMKREEPRERSFSYSEAKHLSAGHVERKARVEKVVGFIPERKRRGDGGYQGDSRSTRHIR
ncbi:MAG: hypothetical protein AAB885_03810 [Patescibacteria group bacterium]